MQINLKYLLVQIDKMVHKELKKKSHLFLKPLIAFIIVIVVGAYLLSSFENVEFGESIYRTFLLVATVSEFPAVTLYGKILSSFLVIIGLGLILYMATTLTRILMTIDLRASLRRRNELEKEETN